MGLEVGARIAERYRVTAAIARGGMGEVWEGVDERLGRSLAIKVLRSELASDATILARFEREALAAARLPHPGIVQILDLPSATAGGPRCLVMERVAGRTLADVLSREGKVAPLRAADLVEQALGALAAAHAAGIVHRDLKPANLMIVPVGVGGRELVKVLDFGLAQLKTGPGYSKLTQTGQILGTPAFMAPEQARGEESDGRTDVYAMGVVLYCLLTGKPPFPGRDPGAVLKLVLAGEVRRADAVDPTVPAELASIAAMAMHRDRSKRFASADAFARALVDFREKAAGRTSLPPPVAATRSRRASSSTSRPRPARTSPAVLALAVGAVLGTIALATTLVIAIVVVPRLVAGAAEPAPTPRVANAPMAPIGGGGVCGAAARCCASYLETMRAPQSRSACDYLATLDAQPGAEPSCRAALQGYRDAITSVGGDPELCEAP